MKESEFNASIRDHFNSRGHFCIHIREANVPGVLDLLVCGPPRELWIELKVGDEPIRPSQREFARDMWQRSGNAFFMRIETWQYDRAGADKPIITIYDGMERVGHYVDADNPPDLYELLCRMCREA